MKSVVDLSVAEDDQIVVAIGRTDTVDLGTPAPQEPIAPDGVPKVYCQGESCKKQWHQVALDVTSALRVKGKLYCASCFATLDGNPAASPVRRLSKIKSFKHSDRDAKLDKYDAIMKDSAEYLVYLCVLVVFWPLPWMYYHRWLKRRPLPEATNLPRWRDRLHWVMAAVSHPQCFFSCVYIWFVYVAIALNCKYAAQTWFWALLEVYTVYFLLLNIIYAASPMRKSAAVPSRRLSDPRQRRPSLRQPLTPGFALKRRNWWEQLFWGIVLTIMPICGVGYAEHLYASLPNTFLIAKVGDDVNSLVFLDTDGQPFADDPAPTVFASRVGKRFKLYLVHTALWVAINLVVVFNGILLHSWVTQVAPSTPFLIPLSSVLQIPANVNYTVHGTLSDICDVNDDGSIRAVWNLVLAPKTSYMNGLPIIEVGFADPFTNEKVYLEALSVGTLDVVTVNADSVSFQPPVMTSKVTLRARFFNRSSCDDVGRLRLLHTSTYARMSIKDQFGGTERSGLPFCLLIKYCVQMYVVAGIVGYSSLQIWSLWLQFDSLTAKDDTDGKKRAPTAQAEVKKKTVDLTLHENLNVWYNLRCRVLKVVAVYTQFVTALMSIALVQLAVAVGGLVVYCISGVAPLPGYYLLILTLLGSLSTLVFLLPLAKALDIQASHEAKLHALLLQLHHERERRSKVDRLSLMACLSRLIQLVGPNDDRICASSSRWGG
ncbi:hypothetical protein SPRG_12030 [Saprolegnia parasitica CBS 223.65]|uniref:Uncharacterized protein n=1 Tax=Saprolegnia parasitica (strain CBS 223.65) TaxID=695850 RepID=A0A067BX90_SAPPC|nr:hypothetical protein SPRG_12030 [Saprolegnia parasitica CBS 223.65]KDO22893.1 hypothetical protein SPRG_12030 [Saprolegnia parasitica CBS 223.65]|eukprot:XP_012206448.1 hypothetical protein SPRG_12030 [Saprolegnia parasitica CBS 223.65]